MGYYCISTVIVAANEWELFNIIKRKVFNILQIDGIIRIVNNIYIMTAEMPTHKQYVEFTLWLNELDIEYIVITTGKCAENISSPANICSVCGVQLNNGRPQMNGMCVDCLADKWGEIVEKSPMVSPQTL